MWPVSFQAMFSMVYLTFPLGLNAIKVAINNYVTIQILVITTLPVSGFLITSK
jgi:hypothetical protein